MTDHDPPLVADGAKFPSFVVVACVVGMLAVLVAGMWLS